MKQTQFSLFTSHKIYLDCPNINAEALGGDHAGIVYAKNRAVN